MKFERISVNPAIMMGKPSVTGTRITVELILQKLGEGYTYEELLALYPNLKIEDIQEVIRFAHAIITHETVLESITA